MIRFPDTVTISKVDNEYVLLNAENGRYYGLNAVATRMMELLLEHRDRRKAAEQLAGEYNASVETILADMDRLLEELRSHGLFEVA